MNLTVLLLIIVVIVVFLVLAIISQIPKRDEIIEQRLQNATNLADTGTLEEIEMAQPFMDRVISPFLHRLGESVNKLFPKDPLNIIQKKIDMAGLTGKFEPGTIILMQGGGALLFGGSFWAIFFFTSDKWASLTNLIVIGGFCVFGFIYPRLWLTNLSKKRQKSIKLSMPDALDLLTICVEAGLGFDAAVAKVSEKWDNELSQAFGRVITEIQYGKARKEALRGMADRVDIPEMTSFIAAVIQSEQLGVSMAKILRIQSDQMRMRRRQHAEEEAHKTPIKMLIPMALLIFPSVFIIIMAPAIFKLMNSAVSTMFK